jgi:hypothetical protein
MTPVVRELAGQAATAALQEALSQKNRMLTSAFAGKVTQATVDNLARGLQQALGPALEEVLRGDITPGLVAGLEGPLGDAVLRLSERVSRQVVLSARETITTPGPGELGSLIDRARDAINHSDHRLADRQSPCTLGTVILLIREGRHRRCAIARGETLR